MDVFRDVSSTRGDRAMAGYDISVSRKLLPRLLGGGRTGVVVQEVETINAV